MPIVLLLEFRVAVPVQFAAAGIGAVEELHEPHAPLDEASCQDAVPREGGLEGIGRVVGPVVAERRGRLRGQVRELGHRELHPRSQLVCGDPRGERPVLGMPPEVLLVEPPEQAPGIAVGGGGDARRGREVPHWRGGGEHRALELRRQEAGPPVVAAGLWNPAWVEDRYERRQVLVFAAERVGDPRAEARKAVEDRSGGEEVLRRTMRVRAARERVHEGDLVGQAGEVRDHLRHPLARPAPRLERVLRPREIARRTLERHGRPSRERLVIPGHEFRLPVPRLELAHGPRAEDHEHVLRLGGEVRRTGRIGPRRIDHRARRRARREEPVVGEQARQRDRAERRRGITEEASPIEQTARRPALAVRLGHGGGSHGWHRRPRHGRWRNSLALNSTRQSIGSPCARTIGSTRLRSAASGSRAKASV